MKLLIYSHFFAPSIGGVETIVLSLARGLAELRDVNGAREFEITLVTQTPVGNYDDSALPFRVVRQPGLLQLWRLIRDADRTLLAGPAILPLFFSLLGGKNPAVTHHGYQAVCPNGMLFQFSPQTNCPGHFAARRYGECVRCNAPQKGLTGSLRLLLLTFIRRSLARQAAANVGVSEHVTYRIALPHSRVIRNAVPDIVDPTRTTIPASSSQQEIRFAYVGRLVTEKGVETLLEAAALLAKQGLTPPILIIGEGPERPALEHQKVSLKLGENVAFLGVQRGAALEKHMKHVSVLVMPSVCQDVAPLSVLEMMMKGGLIICSRIGGLAEQVGEAGLTFAPGDADELAQQMRAALDNPTLATSLGKSARERAVSEYTLQRMIGEYCALLASRH
jgi:glycosyltransferase involved in cell wall biosynthesis